MIDGGLVSITDVKLTPDLLEARVYLSLFQVKDVPATMKKIEERAWEIKRDLAARVKHQLRRIPTLAWFHDDTLEHADRMEALFRKIQADRPTGGDNPAEPGGTDGEAGPQ
jgi:ribosome-binding factor A